MTGGTVDSAQSVVDLVEQQDHSITLFTFGIGPVDPVLIIEAANIGRGKHYFVPKDGEGLEENVIEALYSAFET
jgi:hypothetical protein